ncbi:hypothetical protein [Pseudorhodobacter sp. MZDSW-24AT]|uniref:hypothetical protein n=1 Tax=Pseudorhodobacter sp. MZDSW-24AT TaxID=2052957 RepID=UPI0012FDE77F|nr:hypothetical protein [Pseudorhodobacter sp. MZDSW-24AT]
MTFQSRIPSAQPMTGEDGLVAAPPHAPLQMPRQTLQRSPGSFGLWAGSLLARLGALLRVNQRRAG